jgi:hypothetical protein
VGTIAPSQTVELSVERGYHTPQVSSARHHSPRRSFQAAGGEIIGYSCRAAMIWPQYIAALVKPDLWISLKRA